MSGKAPYGYTLEPTTIDGIRTKMMVANPTAADHGRGRFDMYAQPTVSIGDIARRFTEEGIAFGKGTVTRGTLSQILKNPVYAQADLDLYDFFKGQGAAIVNDAEDFTGFNGCYLYQGRDVPEKKAASLKDHILVVAPHEGLVSSETWLACRKKLLKNTCFTSGSRKAKNSWLTGKLKCGRCGYSLNCIGGTVYLRCRWRAETQRCAGCGTLRVPEVEDFIYREMRRKMADFQTLTGGNPAKANPKLTALNVSLAQVEAEIEKLINTLMGANATLMAYANSKIEELDAKRQSLMKAIADITAEAVSPEHIDRLSGYLETWENVSFEDRRLVADGLISIIKATSESIQIEWKI
jgi:hypothetical protein